jgi:hypothetical protein
LFERSSDHVARAHRADPAGRPRQGNIVLAVV